jgi:thiamine biosynthesis lipoprotein ApbE
MRLQRYEFSQIRMGVDTPIVVYAESEEQAVRACRAAYSRITALEERMSDYRADSELNLLCQRAVERWVKVSPELFYVLWRAQKLAQQTDGAFDVTVGPLVRLWREARRTGKLPDEATLRDAKARSGYRLMELSLPRRAVRLKTERMQLDLGGIAKGYACDCALRELRKYGITRALIQMGGDIVAGDAPPNAQGWKIELTLLNAPGSRFLASLGMTGLARPTGLCHSERSEESHRPTGLCHSERSEESLRPTALCHSERSEESHRPTGLCHSERSEESLRPADVLFLKNSALSTSGSTEQYVEINGVRYAHIIDPRTGLGLTKLILARVRAPDGITADSLATAAAVLGDPDARRLERLYKGVQVMVVDSKL